MTPREEIDELLKRLPKEELDRIHLMLQTLFEGGTWPEHAEYWMAGFMRASEGKPRMMRDTAAYVLPELTAQQAGWDAFHARSTPT